MSWKLSIPNNTFATALGWLAGWLIGTVVCSDGRPRHEKWMGRYRYWYLIHDHDTTITQPVLGCFFFLVGMMRKRHQRILGVLPLLLFWYCSAQNIKRHKPFFAFTFFLLKLAVFILFYFIFWEKVIQREKQLCISIYRQKKKDRKNERKGIHNGKVGDFFLNEMKKKKKRKKKRNEKGMKY